MRQIFRKIDYKTKTGSVKLEATDAEDMWHVYNILCEGDKITAPTIRKVMKESATGSSASERIRLTLNIDVQSVEFDSIDLSIRVTGQVCQQNKHVRIGAFHTIDLEPHRAFVIEKPHWDSVHISRLNLALDPAADADLGAVVMEDGLAHVLLISRSLTLTRARIETNIPRKGRNAIHNRDKATKKFFDDVLQACLSNLNWNTLKVVLIASPGFVKDEFHKHILLEASRRDLRPIIENKGKMVLCHASSGHKHALQEVLQRPEIQGRLSKTMAVSEVRVLTEFHEMLKRDPDRAVYGPAHVKHALDMGAIQQLLVTDKLFRAANIELRKKYVRLVDGVRHSGATTTVFSALHVTGEQLDLMSGVAAILRFPLYDLDEIDVTQSI